MNKKINYYIWWRATRNRKKRRNKKNEFNQKKQKGQPIYCRKFFRKYFMGKESLKLSDETKRIDYPILFNFIRKFHEVIVAHFQKMTKMTLVEEANETHMNAVLRQKMNDLRDQI